MLEHLASKNDYWQTSALRICGDKQTANDLVQRMYLKCYDKQIEIEKLTKSYVIKIMMGIYIDDFKLKKNKDTLRLFERYDIADTEIEQDHCDKDISYLSKAKELSLEEQKLLEQTYDNPLRTIARINDLSTDKVFRKIKKAREQILGEDYDKEYKNRRLKWKKTS